MYDFSNIKGEMAISSYRAGKHLVKFGKWEFDQTDAGKIFLKMEWQKPNVDNSGRPFTTSRLYFSSEDAIKIARHKLHLLCDLQQIKYSEDRVVNSDEILKIGDELKDRDIEIELVPTGAKTDKGNDRLGVKIGDIEFFIRQTDNDESKAAFDAITSEDISPDIPF